MHTRHTLLLLLVYFSFVPLMHAQQGSIRGAVFDKGSGEYLPGVTIILNGTTIGTLTDLDGKFNLKVNPGTYTLKASFISYETRILTDIKVKAGEVLVLDDLFLLETTYELSEVTITARAVRNTENAILTLKRKSANVMDGISAGNFRKTGDSDAASSMKRVTGLSVEGGKYVYVRGLGDRYTKTILNGLDIPGLDPDRNTLQLDLFPTSIIDQIIVYKSFTAELPADFTGGVIDIGLKDFPEKKQGNISFSAGYNPEFHFNSNFLSYEGGKTDFLGFDDGTRAIPATSDIPLFSEVVGNPSGAKGLRYRKILAGFSPVMSARRQASFMDYGIGLSLGNQIAGEKVTVGYHVALSYKSSTEYFAGAEYGRYGLSSDPNVYEMDVREFQKGDYGTLGVLWSGLAGFAVKTAHSKYRINLLHLQNGESRAGIFDYTGSDQGSDFSGFQHNLDYSERALSNLLLGGKHTFGASWEAEWKLSPTFSTMKDPDIRFTRYIGVPGNYVINTESGFPERIWRDLREVNLSGTADIRKSFQMLKRKSELKFGAAYTYKERDFSILNYAFNIRKLTLTGDPDELFNPDNLWPKGGNITTGTTYDAPFIPVNPNQFNAVTQNMAGYASVEFSPFRILKTIVGLRFENYMQRYTGQDQLGTRVLDGEKVLSNAGFFPSLNLILGLTERQNLRFSYARTIARPSFKELSYAEIYDPISGRTFIGGLFRDANDVAGVEYWNGRLVSTDIHNLDLRWEWFPAPSQTISVSGFYKYFINPIEIVQYATLAGAFQPRNVGNGEVLGAEVELRVGLEPLWKTLESFSISANLTWTRSGIKLSATELESRQQNARTGQKVSEYREMAGQAPFIINCGLSYDGAEKGFFEGFEAGLYYNMQGATLQYVGIVDRPDIYSMPFHSLHFNAGKSFGAKKRLQLGLKVENILNDTKESVFRSYNAADQYFTRLPQGIGFQFKIGYSIF